MGIFNKMDLDIFIKGTDSFKLVVREQTTGKAHFLQTLEQPFCSFICRRPVGYQSIVNIKNNPSDSFPVQPFKINALGRIHIFVGKKLFQHITWFLSVWYLKPMVTVPEHFVKLSVLPKIHKAALPKHSYMQDG